MATWILVVTRNLTNHYNFIISTARAEIFSNLDSQKWEERRKNSWDWFKRCSVAIVMLSRVHTDLMPIKCIVKNGLTFWSNFWVITKVFYAGGSKTAHQIALGLQDLIMVSRIMLSLIFCAKSLSTPNWAQSCLFSLSIDYMTSWWYSERHKTDRVWFVWLAWVILSTLYFMHQYCQFPNVFLFVLLH